MPAAAVSPAPKAYAYVVAVEKLVVGSKLFAASAAAARPWRTRNERRSRFVVGRTAGVALIAARLAAARAIRELHVESRSAGCPEKIEAIRAGRTRRPRTVVHGTTEDGRGSAAGAEIFARGNDREERTGAFVLCREG